MERKIIVGYDPEHGGPDALALSRRLAQALSARRVVVTALPWPSYLADREDLLKMAEAEMAETFTKLRDAEGDPELVTRAIPSGSAALALHATAEDEDATLIVLASSHRGALGRTLAGSVGESLMHGAPCAVAVAPHGYGDGEAPDLRNLAVAYDGSAESRAALEATIALARRHGGEVNVLVVADYPHYGYATAWSVLSAGEIVDAERKHKERMLAEGLAMVPSGIPSSGRVMTGSAGRLLSEVSGEFDLMLLGSRAYGSLHRTLLGSTSRTVIRSSECPVLVIPRGTDGDPLGLREDPAVAAAEDG